MLMRGPSGWGAGVGPPQRGLITVLRAFGSREGIEAAQKGAGSKRLKPSRHPIISLVVGILIALAIVAGMFFLLVSQQ